MESPGSYSDVWEKFLSWKLLHFRHMRQADIARELGIATYQYANLFSRGRKPNALALRNLQDSLEKNSKLAEGRKSELQLALLELYSIFRVQNKYATPNPISSNSVASLPTTPPPLSQETLLQEKDYADGERFFRAIFLGAQETINNIKELRQASIALAWKASVTPRSILTITSSAQRSIWQATRRETLYEESDIYVRSQASRNSKHQRHESSRQLRRLVRRGYNNGSVFRAVWSLEAPSANGRVDVDRWRQVLRQIMHMLPPKADLFDVRFISIPQTLGQPLKRMAHDVVILEEGSNTWGLVLFNTEPSKPVVINNTQRVLGTQSDSAIVVRNHAIGNVILSYANSFLEEADRLWPPYLLDDAECEGELYLLEKGLAHNKGAGGGSWMLTAFGLPGFSLPADEMGIARDWLEQDGRPQHSRWNIELESDYFKQWEFRHTQWSTWYKRENRVKDDAYFKLSALRWLVAREYIRSAKLKLLMPLEAIQSLLDSKMAEEWGFTGYAYHNLHSAYSMLEALLAMSRHNLEIVLSKGESSSLIFPNRVTYEVLDFGVRQPKEARYVLALEKQDQTVKRLGFHKTSYLVRVTEFGEAASQIFMEHWKSSDGAQYLKGPQALEILSQTLHRLARLLENNQRGPEKTSRRTKKS